MQAKIEAAFAEHVRNVMAVVQKSTGGAKIAFEVQHGDDGGSHYFCITHLALFVFVMMQGLEHIVTQTINNYNLGIHDRLLLWWLGYPKCSRLSWIFVTFHLKVAT